MRNGRLLFSAVEFFLIVVLFLIGATCFMFNFVPESREFAAVAIVEGGSSFFFLGILFSALAIALGICFRFMQKGSFIRLKARHFSMEEALIRNAIGEFWKKEFPESAMPSEVYCAKNRIEVILPEAREDLQEIESRLGFFLARELGYEQEFFVTLCPE